MKRAIWLLVLVLCVSVIASATGCTQSYTPYSPEELDELLAPVALYPDPLLAQILPAATYPDQIAAAQQVLGGRVDDGLIDPQPWDVSVKAVAHYPDVLCMMSNDQQWTTAVGQAFAQQQADIFVSIQRLRARAYRVGSLTATPQQRVVITSEGTILIVPAQPGLIYVPHYHPQEVYVASAERDETTAALAFGVGLLIGAWLNRDVDWHEHCVYYHGWRGGGWIGASRRYVHLVPIYVNDRFRRIVVNRQIINRHIGAFRHTVTVRARLNRVAYREGHRPMGGFTSPHYGVVHSGAVSRGPNHGPGRNPVVQPAHGPAFRSGGNLGPHRGGTGMKAGGRTIPTPGSKIRGRVQTPSTKGGGRRTIPTPGSKTKSRVPTPGNKGGGRRTIPTPGSKTKSRVPTPGNKGGGGRTIPTPGSITRGRVSTPGTGYGGRRTIPTPRTGKTGAPTNPGRTPRGMTQPGTYVHTPGVNSSRTGRPQGEQSKSSSRSSNNSHKDSKHSDKESSGASR